MQLAARRGLLGALMVVALVFSAVLLAVVSASRPAEAAFPGNNGKIAFTSNRDGQLTADLYSMKANGTGVKRLTTTGFVEDSDWNPRGTRIAFSDQDINIARPDGTVLVTVDHPSNGSKDLSPAWSPDGTRIAFSGVRSLGGSDRDIYTVNTNGTDLQLLTKNTVQEGNSLDWSSTGKIVFDRDGDIFTMNANGTGETRVAGGISFDTNPEWSPDGTKIAYSRGSSGIFTMNADGSGKALRTAPGLIALRPSWSPDGSRIAFDSEPLGGTSDIFIVAASGSRTSTPLTNDAFDDTAPAWQPIVP